MTRPMLFLVIGLSAVLSSGCDRMNDTTATAAQTRSANYERMPLSSEPFRGCEASAKCPNGTSMTCKVEGSGTCSGTDGVGVQCITYDEEGNVEESGGTCGGK